ncbi:hypothetical protein [Micromonospora sp. NPDC005413]|uniref:hypothetical protein n=1 Tax=Micromonospora sp. NPDC005413 TaxID=3154563 RepID=UPI0033A78061
MAGASSFAAITDWLHDLDEQARTRLGFADEVPAGTTVWRLMIRLGPGLLSTVLAGWLQTRTGPPNPRSPRRYRKVIAVDGKTLPGARRDGGGRQAYLLSVLDTTTGVVIAQVAVGTKSMKSRRSRRCSTPSSRCSAPSPECCSSPTPYTPRPVTPRGHPTRRAPACTGESQSADPHRQSRHPRHTRRHRLPHAQQAVRITRTRRIAGQTSRETAYLTVSLPAGQALPASCRPGSAGTGTSKTASITYET